MPATTKHQTNLSANRASFWWIRLLIVAAGIAVYANSFAGVFFFDDQFAIVDNPRIRTLWPIWHSLLTPPDNPTTGRPLTSLSLAVNYAMSGLQPWSYHAMNLAIHLAAALGLFALVRSLLQLPRFEAMFRTTTVWLSLTIALLWEVHPLCTESITYISTRTESLMGMFFVWTVYAAIRAMTSEGRSAKKWSILAIVLCWCSAASKEVGAMAPLVILLIDRTLVTGSFMDSLRRRRWVYAGLFAVWIFSACLVVFGPRSGSVGFHFEHATPWRYLITQSEVLLHYVRLVFLPWPLAVDYHDWRLAASVAEVWLSAVVIVALLAMTVVGLWLARSPSWKLAALAGAWFFLVLAPTSSILPLSTEVAAERRMYLPLMAVIGAAVLGTHAIFARWLPPRARAISAGSLCVLAVVGLAALTIDRNRDYHSVLTIWSEATAARPGNARAHLNLALALSSPEIARPAEAIAEFRRAIELEPNNYLAHARLGTALVLAGDREGALKHAHLAANNAPSKSITRQCYGFVLGALGRPREAETELREAIAIDPRQYDAWRLLAQALADQGRTVESREALERANRLRYLP